MKPYSDKAISNSEFIRTFSETVDATELHWHRDKESRKIDVIESTGWFLQLDNKMPIELKSNDTFVIYSGIYHRILKNDNAKQLIVKITEML